MTDRIRQIELGRTEKVRLLTELAKTERKMWLNDDPEEANRSGQRIELERDVRKKRMAALEMDDRIMGVNELGGLGTSRTMTAESGS